MLVCNYTLRLKHLIKEQGVGNTTNVCSHMDQMRLISVPFAVRADCLRYLNQHSDLEKALVVRWMRSGIWEDKLTGDKVR